MEWKNLGISLLSLALFTGCVTTANLKPGESIIQFREYDSKTGETILYKTTPKGNDLLQRIVQIEQRNSNFNQNYEIMDIFSLRMRSVPFRLLG